MLTNKEIKEEIEGISEDILKGADRLINLIRKNYELERKVEELERRIENTATIAGII